MRAGLAAAVAVGLLIAGCSGLLFFPMRTLVRTPSDAGLAWRDVGLSAADGTSLHGWWLPAEGPARGTVYFLHGNAENISTHLVSVFWLPARGYQVFLLDYRGYGRSAGAPRLPAVFSDIEAGFAWLTAQPEVRGRPLFLFGQSLGAALGGYLAATDPLMRGRFDGVVLDSGFTRYRDIARTVAASGWVTWPLQWPIAWGMPRGYDLVDVVGDISPVPLLLVHGRSDDTVPFSEAGALYAAARPPKQAFFHDGGHIQGFISPDGRERLLRFFEGAAH